MFQKTVDQQEERVAELEGRLKRKLAADKGPWYAEVEETEDRIKAAREKMVKAKNEEAALRFKDRPHNKPDFS